MAGQDKPIVSPREPNSLAQVAVSPLTGAGNLWLWSPQVRLDQRFAFGRDAGLTAQIGVYETSEPAYAARGGDNSALTSTPRPALEGRFELWRKFGENARIEIAPGFHDSTSHAGGFSAPSHLFTMDWLIQPAAKVQLTGMFFTGENAAGLGGLRQGFTIFNDIRAVPIGVAGGWEVRFSYLCHQKLPHLQYFRRPGKRPHRRPAQRRYSHQLHVRRKRHLPAGFERIVGRRGLAGPHKLLPATVKTK